MTETNDQPRFKVKQSILINPGSGQETILLLVTKVIKVRDLRPEKDNGYFSMIYYDRQQEKVVVYDTKMDWETTVRNNPDSYLYQVLWGNKRPWMFLPTYEKPKSKNNELVYIDQKDIRTPNKLPPDKIPGAPRETYDLYQDKKEVQLNESVLLDSNDQERTRSMIENQTRDIVHRMNAKQSMLNRYIKGTDELTPEIAQAILDADLPDPKSAQLGKIKEEIQAGTSPTENKWTIIPRYDMHEAHDRDFSKWNDETEKDENRYDFKKQHSIDSKEVHDTNDLKNAVINKVNQAKFDGKPGQHKCIDLYDLLENPYLIKVDAKMTESLARAIEGKGNKRR